MSDNAYRSETSIADFFNISQAAEYLGVSTSTLRNWDQSGTFKAFRHPINNYRLYRKDDLTKLLGHLRSPGMEPPSEVGVE